ncbi:hypothetical protein WG899_12120 [Paucibacter sp. AS339]|uniref:hypothetical protein n=1 Tax=Paucibacter hankyongi TaxID=3133434 RepID=UPI0030B11586
MLLTPTHDALSDARSQQALNALRFTIAVLIAIHGWTRFLHGHVPGFGVYLGHHGLPMAAFLGATMTALEALAPLLLSWRRIVFPMSLVYAFIYMVGIPVHHLQNGWFSSGSEVDGCEYPVLMIVCFLCVAWQHAPQSLRRRGLVASA